MRTTVRVALGAAAAVLAGIVAPAAAQAAPPSLGPTISTLPAFASDGGGGTPQLDSAVSNACASGATLAAAEWFTLAQDAWGPVLVDADREIGTTGRSPYLYSTTHTAFVNLSSGTVLQCGGGPVTIGGTQSVAIVAWVDLAEWQGFQDSCTTDGFGCDQTTHLYVDRSAAVPDNDAPANARSIGSLPFSDTGNSVRATDDIDAPSSCSVLSMVEPKNWGSVWWRWKAPVDGVVDAAAHATAAGSPQMCTGLLDVTSGTPSPVDNIHEDLLPSTRTAVVAGHTYLVGAFTTNDGYTFGDPLQHGGPYALDVSWVSRGPGPVVGLTTTTAGTDGIAVSWQPPAATAGAATVTGYHVSVVKHGSADVPFTVTTGAATLEHTFVGLVPGASYDIAVHALSTAGDGELRTRVFSLADAGVYGALAGPPAAPVVHRATSAVTLGWTVPAYTGTTDVTGYRIRVFAGLTPTLVTTLTVADVRVARVSGLRNGVAYTLDVAAVNSAGVGTPSRRSNLVVPASRPGAPVIGVAAAGVPGGATSAVARWTAPRATGGAPITGYVVTAWRVDATGRTLWIRTSAVQPATARLAILRLPAGTYRFSVRAVNVMGVGATSARSNVAVSR